MASYEYLCLSCEHRFEDRRPMAASVDTALACPACRSERVRRRFSFAANTGAAASYDPSPRSGGCACGGACACRG